MHTSFISRRALFAVIIALYSCACVLGESGFVKFIAGDGNELSKKSCMIYDSRWKPLSLSWTEPVEIAFVSPPMGCSEDSIIINNAQQLEGRIAVFQRGNCSFSWKVLAAVQNGAVAVIIFSESRLTMPIAANKSDYDLVNVPVIMVDDNTIEIIHNLEYNTSAVFASEKTRRIDPNVVIFFIAAWICLLTPCVWVARDMLDRHHRATVTNGVSNENNGEPEDETIHFRLVHAIIFVFVASTALLLIYFLYQYIVYIIIVLFMISSSAALYRLLVILPISKKAKADVQLPFIGRVTFYKLAAFAVAISLAIWWFVVRHGNYAWLLQDILGIAFIISALQTLRTPSFRVTTAILVGFVLYDVFFVFITPFFTKNNDSVMVTAATGGGRSNEPLPLTLRVPRLLPACFSGDSLLGFGDIIIPGLAVVYCTVYDTYTSLQLSQHNKTWLQCYPYAVSAFVAYTIGLGVTYVALASMNTAQPALLYLGPSLIVILVAVAYYRGELSAFWSGRVKCGAAYRPLAPNSIQPKEETV